MALAGFFLYPSLKIDRPSEPAAAPVEQRVERVQPIEEPAVEQVEIIATAITPPKPIRTVAPLTPEGIRNRITGMIPIDVKVRIGENGAVTRADAVRSADGLRSYLARRAVEAAQQWRFSPARQDGKAAPSETVIRFKFRRSGTEWN